jgi:Ca-activated chloride channel family protein
MDLKWPSLPLPLLAAVGVLLLVVAFRRRGPVDALLVAHTERLRALPRYRTLARRELLTGALLTLGALVLVVGAVLLAARPIRVEVTQPDPGARDIELCLDVSASMDPWNRQVVDGFGRIVEDLAGERMGLTIFSGNAVTVFPVTDDYEFILERLEEAETAFRTTDYDYFVGAEARGERASQIGDGLVSCVQRFDEENRDGRGRAVVLASDNDPVGEEIFTLDEAAQHSVREGVVVYGIGTPDLAAAPARATPFASAVESTGGSLAILGGDDQVDDVVAGIQRLERSRVERAPGATVLDDPAPAFWVTAAGLMLLLLGALLRRSS